jgi:hypothetical protein
VHRKKAHVCNGGGFATNPAGGMGDGVRRLEQRVGESIVPIKTSLSGSPRMTGIRRCHGRRPFYRGLRVDRRTDFLAEFFTAFMRDVFLEVFLEAGKVFTAFRRRASAIAVGVSGPSMVAGAGLNATTFSGALASSTMPELLELELI